MKTKTKAYPPDNTTARPPPPTRQRSKKFDVKGYAIRTHSFRGEKGAESEIGNGADPATDPSIRLGRGASRLLEIQRGQRRLRYRRAPAAFGVYSSLVGPPLFYIPHHYALEWGAGGRASESGAGSRTRHITGARDAPTP